MTKIPNIAIKKLRLDDTEFLRRHVGTWIRVRTNNCNDSGSGLKVHSKLQKQ